MRTATFAAVIGMTLAAAQGASERNVTVCVAATDSRLDQLTVGLSEVVASRIFAEVAIHVEWRSPRNCPDGALQVSFAYDTPEKFRQGAMAYALPYEGTHIVVFADRVRAVKQVRTHYLLGHVLAHEIGHMLEGISRHSKAGLMKAQWGMDDYASMAYTCMKFDAEDLYLLNAAFVNRDRALLAVNRAEQ